MEALADELRRSLEVRIAALESELDAIKGQAGRNRRGLTEALDLASRYPKAIREFAAVEWERAPDSESRTEILQMALRHVIDRTAFVEQWFARGTTMDVPLFLIKAMERACEELGLRQRHVVIGIGAPDNFETYIADPYEFLFGDLVDAHTPPEKGFAMVLVPRFEGADPRWHPVVLGHELAHSVLIQNQGLESFDLAQHFDWERAEHVDLNQPVDVRLRFLFDTATRWAVELLCDAFAVHRYGPAGVASLAEFLHSIGAFTLESWTHPPGWLRTKLMLEYVRPFEDTRAHVTLQPWSDLGAIARPKFEPWMEFLVDTFEPLADHLISTVHDWGQGYEWRSRQDQVEHAVSDLEVGIPPFRDSAGALLMDQDIVSATWIAASEDARPPIARLAVKAIDTLEFMKEWKEAGGSEPETVHSNHVREPGSGMLSEREIHRRLQSNDGDRLVIRPLLPGGIAGAGVDIRLGSRFIMFQRTTTASFDPLKAERHPREMQVEVERAWGEPFVLHPNELILAATLEYITLPADLAAQVITRSSYGRLGLITATAIQVHPHYQGCLTLELVNLGELPLELMPGARIGQLVFQRVSPPSPEPTQKYKCSTGPEFSKVSNDSDSEILNKMRSSTV